MTFAFPYLRGLDIQLTSTPDQPMVLTKTQICAMADISATTFSAWRRKGVIPAPIPGTWKWRREEVGAALTGQSIDDQHLDPANAALREFEDGQAA